MIASKPHSLMRKSDLLHSRTKETSSLINFHSNGDSQSQMNSELDPFSFQQSSSVSSENPDSFSQDLSDFPLLAGLFTLNSKDSVLLATETKEKNENFGFSGFHKQNCKNAKQNRFEKNAKILDQNFRNSSIKKANVKTRSEKNLIQIKRLLAILKNWGEVCKTVPKENQVAYKEKIIDYVKRKISPTYKNEKKMFLNYHEPLENEKKWFSDSRDGLSALFGFGKEELQDEISTMQENNKNLFSELENYSNNLNSEEKNFLNFGTDPEYDAMDLAISPTHEFQNQFSLN